MHQWSFIKLRRLCSNLHRMTVVVPDGKHNDSAGTGTFSQATRHLPVRWRYDVALKKKRNNEWPFKPGPCDLFPSLICTREDKIKSKYNKVKHCIERQSFALESVRYLQLLSPGLKLTDQLMGRLEAPAPALQPSCCTLNEII